MTGHTWGFTSRTVSGVLVLFYLTLVQTLTGASVHHNVRRDGVERHDRQIAPAHGAVPIDVYRISRTRMKEKKDPATLEAFFSFSFFYFSSSVTRAFPSSIKGEAGRLSLSSTFPPL